MSKRRILAWVILAFLLGVLACHFFYYSTSYFTERKMQSEIDRLKYENAKTQQDLDKIDSLLIQIQ